MKYKAILLDADDTLFDFAAAEEAAFKKFLALIELRRPDALSEYVRINTACWLDLERGILTQKELRVRRFREFFSIYAHPMQPEVAAETYETLLGEQATLLPGALDAVKEIASKLPVAIVTNGITKVQRARISASPIKQYISALVISEEVGVAKPDPKMIYEALNIIGMPGERAALMAGDSIKSDIAAAVNAGIDACWVNPRNEKRPDGVSISYEIASVGELVQIALSE